MLDTIRNASLPFRVPLIWIEINVSALVSKKKMMTNLVWLQLLESKIQEAKSKKDTLKARAQSARYVQRVCFICSFVLWPKGMLREVIYRLWYLMLFCILWHLKLWIRRLQTIPLFPLFWNSEVLSIMEDWMWFDYRRLLGVPIIDKHWQS